MKLSIKQKLLTFGEKFSVYDENGKKRWFSKSEAFSFGVKVRIFNAESNQVAVIRQQNFFKLTPPNYIIEIGAERYTLGYAGREKQRYCLGEKNWEIAEDESPYNYKVYCGGELVMAVVQKAVEKRNERDLELNFENGNDELLALSITLIFSSVNNE